GGKIAGDKISHLLDFTRRITVISPHCTPRVTQFIEQFGLTYIPRPYRKGDIEGFAMAIVAVDSIELQKAIYEESRHSRTLINSVDSAQYCDFIFPSYIKRGDLVVAFSTGGASPSLAKYLRRAVERLLPPDIGEFVSSLKRLRQTLPKGRERMELLDRKAKEYIDFHFRRDNVQ
ncbi:MAG: bifunctional precorrin-2 dehydrogenase/sirohydrochlorin ferrochelatase, partial [Epsilonproteobacteria bacterium]|nr:siroheme synthase [Campylobacterota bacterium]NPA56362.1 bifunctional precorrin-2 dehydrogenase/sirohydrochlorin ferrochelatase [Campylobacterota bacterium]